MPTYTCEHCGKTYHRPPSQRGQFCSKRCAYDHRIKENPSTRRILYLPDHPLANSGGQIHEARVILYEKIGPGPHHCYWCSVKIKWATKQHIKYWEGVLTCDHLDNNEHNNSPNNLVPSCHQCNSGRSNPQRIRPNEGYSIRGKTKLRHITISCAKCGQPLTVTWSDAYNTKRRGTKRFCPECHLNRTHG